MKFKYFLFLLLYVCVSVKVQSQEMYYKLYTSGDFVTLEKRLQQAIANQPNNVLFNHVYGKLYANKNYTQYNLAKSYSYLLQAKLAYPNIPIPDKERFAKLNLNQTVINKDFDSVCNAIWNETKIKNSVKECNDFLIIYAKANKDIRDNAIQYRNSLAFDEAKKINTEEAFQSFITAYPDAQDIKLAIKLRDELAYSKTLQIRTTEAYKTFLDTYPQSIYYKEIQNLYGEQIFKEQTIPDNFKSFEKFIVNNPRSPLIPMAIEKMMEIAKAKKDVKLMKKTVDYSVPTNFEYALYEYYKYISQDGEYLTLYNFVLEYPRTFLDTLLAKDFKIAELAERLEFIKPLDTTKTQYYIDYIKLGAPKEKAFVALQKLISVDVSNKKWNKALATVKSLAPYFGKSDERINSLIKILSAPTDNSIIVKSIPGEVNTKDGGEYAPVPSADNKYLYFCGRNRTDNKGGEDIFVSEFQNNQWSKPQIIEELSTPTENEAVISISIDGTKMIFYREGIIYYSEKTPFGWSPGVSVSDEINSAEWTGDAMITSDGNAIIFTSVRTNGMNFYVDNNATLGQYHGSQHHQSDIYVSVKTGNSWGKPKSLGTTINTIYTERSAFLYQDMKTLYFSSDGHGGLGNLDVYRSTRLSDTCWDCWSKPINLGKEINNSEENWDYRISPDGKNFYFAARQTGEETNDIMMVAIPNQFVPEAVVTVTGKLTDLNKKPISATIRYEDLSTGLIIGETKTDPKDGSYLIVLPNGKIYGYYIDNDTYYPQSQFVDLSKSHGAKLITEDISAISYQQMKLEKIPVRLNNLFFDTNKSDLLPYSIPELKRVAKIIQKNQLRIEISGHTDNVGEDAFNMDLSLRRAQAVKDYLVSQGCSPQLFEVKGYGETKPNETNDTPQGRAKNRRVELRFL